MIWWVKKVICFIYVFKFKDKNYICLDFIFVLKFIKKKKIKLWCYFKVVEYFSKILLFIGLFKLKVKCFKIKIYFRIVGND